MTKVKLELLTDPNMLLMFEKGIRCGITQGVHRYAKANNKYMGDQYKPIEKMSYLQYLDANNLYGWAMNQDLPTDGFKWKKKVELFTAKKIARLVKKNKMGIFWKSMWSTLQNCTINIMTSLSCQRE